MTLGHPGSVHKSLIGVEQLLRGAGPVHLGEKVREESDLGVSRTLVSDFRKWRHLYIGKEELYSCHCMSCAFDKMIGW